MNATSLSWPPGIQHLEPQPPCWAYSLRQSDVQQVADWGREGKLRKIPPETDKMDIWIQLKSLLVKTQDQRLLLAVQQLEFTHNSRTWPLQHPEGQMMLRGGVEGRRTLQS